MIWGDIIYFVVENVLRLSLRGSFWLHAVLRRPHAPFNGGFKKQQFISQHQMFWDHLVYSPALVESATSPKGLLPCDSEMPPHRPDFELLVTDAVMWGIGESLGL